MIFDDYLQNYTGYGITVTIIDTGVKLSREGISHYKYDNEEIVKCDVIGNESSHGSSCAETILRLAPNVKLNDICIEKNGKIPESALICALNFAYSSLENDIICICLALDEYSINLAEILKKFKKTFIFASGRKDNVSYPADLCNVIKINYDSEVTGVKIISENVIAVNCEGMKSSSIACAYITGLFSAVLEAKALWQFDDIKNAIFRFEKKPIIEHQSLILPDEFIAHFPVEYLEHKNNFIDNLIGYYDDNMVVRDFNGTQLKKNIKTIYVNPEERKKVITPSTVGDYFAGHFDNSAQISTIQLQNHYAVESDYICDVSKPIIALASFGYGASKFDLQVKIYNNISKLGYNVKNSTYNPMGILFKDFVVFEYPKQILCPKIIYSINRFIYESSITDDPDMFILNVGGSIRTINYHNPYDMGMLFEVYMKAFRIDVVLLCVNINVSIDTILYEIERLKAANIPEVILVISDNQYDIGTYELGSGMRYFKCSSDKQEDYAEKLREKYSPSLVHLLDKFDSLDVTETIVMKLT
jgi:hypothetical protein